MATADYWSSADLKGLDEGGLIAEDVMDQIWQIDPEDTPVADRVMDDKVFNSYAEWTTDELAARNVSNARVDGSDSTTNDAKGGARVGNQCQISTKDVAVTSRARESRTFGRGDELAYQISQRQKELRLDVDAIYLENQGSQADDGDTTPGLTGGLPSWLETNTSRGATGADGGFSSGVVSAPTPGTARGLTETLVRDINQGVYQSGGKATVFMSVPSVIRGFSSYMFTDGARVATLGSDQGKSASAATALGAVNVFVDDFGVLELVPNRNQQMYDDATGTPVPVANVFIMDPGHLRIGRLAGYQVEPLAKAGLADKRLMRTDWCVKVLNEKAQGLIADIDPTIAVVA